MIVTQLVKILQKHVPYYTFLRRKYRKSDIDHHILFLIAPIQIEQDEQQYCRKKS